MGPLAALSALIKHKRFHRPGCNVGLRHAQIHLSLLTSLLSRYSGGVCVALCLMHMRVEQQAVRTCLCSWPWLTTYAEGHIQPA